MLVQVGVLRIFFYDPAQFFDVLLGHGQVDALHFRKAGST
jgi:hypothetical protein